MKIFLSYGHDDNAELVQKIRDDLENGINGGHDAWIDKFKIKAGDEWRRSITDGIIDSERVLAFMSKHSVREPGVCHDELAIALGHKGGNISTVLVEPLKDEELPLSVSHIQRLDMSDWKARKAEDPEAFEVWYREKFAEILRIIRENAGFSGEIEKLAEKLRPMDNNPIIGGLLGRGFVGRGWLFEEIEAWRKNERHNRVYCLAAGPGFGKSAISAWLAHTNKIQVIAAHFCRYDQPNWSEPGAVIRNIAFQMATRLPDYRRFLLHQIEHLEKNASTMDLGAELTRLGRTGQPISSETITQLAAQAQTPKTFDKLTPAELFDTLIAGPAQIGIDGGRERYLIVIDALDEAGKELIRYLADRQNDLPRWLALFATSRPNDDGVQQFLTRLNAHSVEPDNDSNRDDAREWIGTWLTERKMPEAQQAPIVEPLLAASEANFHYLTAYRQMVEHAGPAGDALLKAPEAYPKGLSGLYLQFFERQFGGDDQRLGNYRQHQRPLLRLVMASRRPLPVALARQAFKVSQPGAETEDFVSQVLLPLGSLFPKTGTGEEQTIRPFHKSLRDWLTNPDAAGQYYIDPVAGHETLGRLLWQEFVAKQDAPETLTEYAVTELPYHLLALSEEQELALGIDRFAWERMREAAGHIADNLQEKVCWPAATTWLRWGLRSDERWFGAEHLKTVTTLNNLAMLLKDQGELSTARPFLERALAIYEKVLGAEHPETALIVNNLALLLKDQGELSGARSFLERALAINERYYGVEHPNTARSLANLAALLHGQRDFSGAQALCERALAIREKVLGSEHPETAISLNNLAMLLQDQGDLSGARRLHERALAIREKMFGAEHPDMATSLNNMAMLLQAQGDLSGARPFYERALAIREKVLGAEHPDTAKSLSNLAWLLLAHGDLSGARPLLDRALAVHEKSLGAEHPDTLTSLDNLAVLLQKQGDLSGARRLIARAEKIRGVGLGAGLPLTLASLKHLLKQNKPKLKRQRGGKPSGSRGRHK